MRCVLQQDCWSPLRFARPLSPGRSAAQKAAPAAPAAAPAPAPAPAAAAPTQPPQPARAACNNPNALGVGRTVEIDTTGGPGFGFEHFKELDFLKDHEVVLTFDDGPWARTRRRCSRRWRMNAPPASSSRSASTRPIIRKSQAGLCGRPHHRHAHLVARHPGQQEADRRSAQGRDREGHQRREMGARRRLALAVLPLPGAAASAGDGHLSRHSATSRSSPATSTPSTSRRATPSRSSTSSSRSWTSRARASS